jgi:hypothetical protein
MYSGLNLAVTIHLSIVIRSIEQSLDVEVDKLVNGHC